VGSKQSRLALFLPTVKEHVEAKPNFSGSPFLSFTRTIRWSAVPADWLEEGREYFQAVACWS
jgi:hypothetical protein